MVGDRSLRGNVDATDKINDIRLSLNSVMGSKMVWILVEGEDDCKLYDKFFDAAKAKVEFVNGGKGQLTIALNTLTAETEQVIGIQDADFLHLDKSYPAVKNLFYTDFHDIETTMLNFNDVLRNLFTEYRMQKQQEDIWTNVLEETSYIAYIRWYNDKNNCEILFSGLRFGKEALSVVSDGKITLHKEGLLRELNERSQNKTEELTSENIDSFIVSNKTNDLLNLCNGHDLTALLSLIIGGKVSHNEFCRHLRLSFTFQYFSQTKLYSAISTWQTESGYSILKNIA